MKKIISILLIALLAPLGLIAQEELIPSYIYDNGKISRNQGAVLQTIKKEQVSVAPDFLGGTPVSPYQFAEDPTIHLFQYEDYIDSTKIKRREKIKALGWTNMLALNGAYAIYPEWAIGVTYARVRMWGGYVSVMSNFNFKSKADYKLRDPSSRINNIDGVPFYTGVIKSARHSITGGVVARLGLKVPMYWYAGLGYGFRGAFNELYGGKWVRFHSVTSSPGHMVAWETGLMGNIKGFGCSLGISGIGGYMEGKIGLGYCF